ncbi:hypothetical protein SCG7086_AA_00570 [Chlamydiales bacterium SCGC AG-110-P3]|nr:hypothetical protein SCG7086_AA_00570 [Chlamydiales bacterium SCGC AG-110-P3]
MTPYRIFTVLIAALLMLTSAVLFADDATSEQALAVRRIARLWEDRHDTNSRTVIQQQIKLFLSTHTETAFQEQMVIMLGDIAMLDGDPIRALKYYSEIKSTQHSQRILERRLHCLQRLGRTDEVISEIETHEHLINELNSRIPLPVNLATLISIYAEALFQKGTTTVDPEVRAHSLEKAKKCYKRTATAQMAADERLAEIHALLGDHSKAVESYLLLAEQKPLKAATYQLQAARLQIECSREDALDTLATVDISASQSPSHTALTLASMWYDLNAYQRLLDSENELTTSTTGAASDRISLLLGHSAYQVGDPTTALKYLQPLCITDTTLDPPHHQGAILTAITCAQQTHHPALTATLAKTFLHEHPHHLSISKVKLTLAWAIAELGDLDKAIEAYIDLAQTASDPAIAETASYETQRLQFQQKQFTACYEGLHHHVLQYPSGRFCNDIHLLFIDTVIQLLNRTDSNDPLYDRYREFLVKEVDAAFAISDLCLPHQRVSYGITIAKALLRANCHDAVIQLLEDLLVHCNENRQSANLHLIAATAALMRGGDPEQFITHAERALSLNPEIKSAQQLRINLFSQYLALTQNQSLPSEEHLSTAAKHLYSAYQLDPTIVSKGNLSWLANYYYRQAIQDSDTATIAHSSKRLAAGRCSVDAFEMILSPESTTFTSEAEVAKENDLVKLSHLYTLLGDQDKKHAVLSRLENLYLEHPTWPWQQRCSILLAIGDSYRITDQTHRAIRRYQRVLEIPHSEASYPHAMAAIHLARNAFKKLPEADRTLDSLEVTKLTKMLMSVQQKRALVSEPGHLEAALERCHIVTTCTPPSERQSTQLELLQTVKATFSSNDSVWEREYHAQRQEMPQKDRLYQAYMILVDAKIAVLQSTMEKTTQGERRLKAKAAQTLFQALLDGQLATTEYLQSEAQAGLQSIKSISLNTPQLFSITSEVQ